MLTGVFRINRDTVCVDCMDMPTKDAFFKNYLSIDDETVMSSPHFCDICGKWVKSRLNDIGLCIAQDQVLSVPGNCTANLNLIMNEDDYTSRMFILTQMRDYVDANIAMARFLGLDGIGLSRLCALRTFLAIT